MLKLLDIKKQYTVADSCVWALKGINLEFRQNEFVSILGQSGCGKTTLLNIIGGLDKYTSGDLIIENVSTKYFKDADWDAYRNHKIGFVFQSYNLISHLNVLNNVELALTISGVSPSERKQRAIDALTKVGLKDHIYKKPNQLSGGQMQRVAIARAIVNDPEILLADEPTGALDTATSIQIMDIIKEISKERLVIMVTHNPELAEKYSTRIVKLLDGQVVEDSNPYNSSSQQQNITDVESQTTNKSENTSENNIINDSNTKNESDNLNKKQKNKKNSPFKKTSMSFWTALTLSFKNLLSKKGRTMLVSLASSIGIIGVSLVLALSNGFSQYISKLQSDMLSTYPLTISGKTVDLISFASLFEDSDLDKFPEAKEIVVNKILEKLANLSTGSDITQDFIDKAINTLDPSLYYDIVMETGQKLNVYTINEKNGNYKYVDVNTSYSMLGSFDGDTKWQILLNNKDFILSQYEVLEGTYPTNDNELVLFVDEYNQLADTILESLGIDSSAETIDFNSLIGKKFYIFPNDYYYTQTSTDGITKFTTLPTNISEQNFELVKSQAIEVTISCILRQKPDTQNVLYSSGVAFSKNLLNTMLTLNENSQIVNFAKSNQTIDPLTGEEYNDTTNTIEEMYETRLRELGGIKLPNYISIYPVDFEAKNAIKAHIDEYNSLLPADEQVHYTDVMQLFMSALTTLIDTISYVLVAFSAISLIVSSIMIAVITYVSVIERTKEIGILRSIGARKKDISRVFNAETFIIGMISGLLGIIITYILTIPINLIINSLADGIGNLAVLAPLTALIMVAISVGLTMLSGLIPSRIASKKNPIECLRSE